MEAYTTEWLETNKTHQHRKYIRSSVFTREAIASLYSTPAEEIEQSGWCVLIYDRVKNLYLTRTYIHPGPAVIDALDWCDGAQVRIVKWRWGKDAKDIKIEEIR